MSSISVMQALELSVKTCFDNLLDKISNEFNIDKTKLVELMNSPNVISDPNQKNCPYLATTGKNIGKVCGKKCKKDFCYSHQPDVLEKKRIERENKKNNEEQNKITIEGEDIDDIVNNLFLDYDDSTSKCIKGSMSREILESLINKKITQHEKTDDEDYEENGYPVSIVLAKTKLRVEYEDGKGLQKSLVNKNSCLSEGQRKTLYDYISSIEVEPETKE